MMKRNKVAGFSTANIERMNDLIIFLDCKIGNGENGYH